MATIYSAIGSFLGWLDKLTGNYVVALFLFAIIVEILLLPLGVKQQKNSIRQAKLKEPCCVLIGNEGKGLSAAAVARSKEKSIIPIENMESLNAAAAASIFLWEIARGGGSLNE